MPSQYWDAVVPLTDTSYSAAAKETSRSLSISVGSVISGQMVRQVHLFGVMTGKLRILPSSALARASRACPLLEEQSDREAWVACCSRRFLPLAKRLAGDNDLAADILQESWVRVLEHVCEYRGGSPACSWVRAIVHNCALDLGRERWQDGDEPSADLEAPSPNPAARAEQRQLLVLLHAMVATLPAAYREVCELRYGQDLSTVETAHRLGISPSNVATRLDRAVGMLRSRLDARLSAQVKKSCGRC